MADTTLQLPPEGTGTKGIRGRIRGGAGTQADPYQLDQYMALSAADTWVAYADAVAFAASKHHIAVFNATGSGKVVRVKKLFAVNLLTATATGVVVRFDAKRITAASAGTTVTPVTHDTLNAALPAQVTVRTNGTVTEGPLLFPWITSTDEETAVAALSKALFQQSVNIIPEGPEVQEVVCREGEGLTLKQITSSAVGSYGWILIFTVE